MNSLSGAAENTVSCFCGSFVMIRQLTLLGRIITGITSTLQMCVLVFLMVWISLNRFPLQAIMTSFLLLYIFGNYCFIGFFSEIALDRIQTNEVLLCHLNIVESKGEVQVLPVWLSPSPCFWRQPWQTPSVHLLHSQLRRQHTASWSSQTQTDQLWTP